MRLSDWINNIRWKYFTNEKAGLIFKELMKEFEMVNKMTENKRYEYWEESDTAYDTKIRYGQYFRIIDKKDMVCLLNEQDAVIKRLKTIRGEQIQTILKQKRKIKELTAQLKTDEEDDICIKCKHHYLINYPESSKYYISKCKKEHEECSKEYIRFCEDFEFELDGDGE